MFSNKYLKLKNYPPTLFIVSVATCLVAAAPADIACPAASIDPATPLSLIDSTVPSINFSAPNSIKFSFTSASNSLGFCNLG